VCADVNPLPSLLQQVSDPVELALVFPIETGWLQINPLVFTLSTETLSGGWGLHEYVDWVNWLLTNLSQITVLLLKIQA